MNTGGQQFLCGHFHGNKYLPLFGNKAKWCTFLRDPVQRVLSEYKHLVRNYGYTGDIAEFCAQSSECDKQSEYIGSIGFEDMYFLGVTEQYHRSIQLFNKLSGMAVPYLEANKGKKRVNDTHDISSKVVSLIEENNKSDVELYRSALKFFENKCAEYNL